MLLTPSLINNLGADEAVSRCSNEKGLVIARRDAFQKLFPGETLGTRRTYTVNENTALEDKFEITILTTNVPPDMIWKSKADK